MLAEWEERVRSGGVAGRAMRAQAEVEGEALRMGLWAVLDGAAPWVGVAVDGDRAEVRWSGVAETGFGDALIAGVEAFEVGMRERMAVVSEEAAPVRLRPTMFQIETSAANARYASWAWRVYPQLRG